MSVPAQHAALLLEYDGTGYRGWSRQPDHGTVEGTLLEACEALQLDARDLRCAGRTDAGVHACGQVVSLHYRSRIEPQRLGAALNQQLPADMSVVRSTRCAETFDARAAALSRSYRYRVLTRTPRSPLRARRALHHPRPVDHELLDAAAALIVGQHDFTAFTPSQTSHQFFHRTVYESFWRECDDELVFHIRANAFLRHMVRILMGTMLAIGRGDWQLHELERLLQGALRSEALATAAPHALCLFSVEYPPELAPFPPDVVAHAAASVAQGR